MIDKYRDESLCVETIAVVMRLTRDTRGKGQKAKKTMPHSGG